MKLKYDLHIHSALSPCADNEMTPNNIVNMAYVNGLDLIAVTDHNSAGNLRVIANLAKNRGIWFLPGLEVESSEEVHIVTLFANVDQAEEFGHMLQSHLCGKANIPDIFGNQYVMDEHDHIVGEENKLLLFATDIPAAEIFDIAHELGGVAYYAHANKASNSVLAILGDFPGETASALVEAAHDSDMDARLDERTVLRSSDAHMLAQMNRGEHVLDIPGDIHSTQQIIDYLRELQQK